MNALQRMGIAYGKLGLRPAPELIALRGQGVEAAVENFDLAGASELLKCGLGLKLANDELSFLSAFREADPTFDVSPTDQEAQLLAAAVLDFAIEGEYQLSGELAKLVVTSSLGGVRSFGKDNQLDSRAQAALAIAQGKTAEHPNQRTYKKIPSTLEAAIQAVTATQAFSQSHPQVIAALNELAKYSESSALAAARSDNELLDYVKKLERELRIHWWVSGGWSSELNKPFRDLSPAEAGVLAGKELAEKSFSNLGMFSAPALIDTILQRGRTATASRKISIADAVISIDRDWRSENFGPAAQEEHAILWPISTALGLAANSNDEDDWKPRFKRITGIDVALKLAPSELALQIYREQLAARILAD